MRQGEAERHFLLWSSRGYRRGFVYVLHAPPLTPIKVGYAADVWLRIDSLQTGSPYKLEPLHIIPADRRLECLLHRRLKDAKLLNEWFDGPEVEEFLEYVADLAHRMVTAWRPGNKEPKHYADLDPELREEPKKGPAPVTVRYVEPNPKTTPEEALELKQAAILGKHPLGYKPSRYNWPRPLK